MAEASDTAGIIHQNLKDAGCDEQTTEKCMTLLKTGNLREMLPVLFDYRKRLLDTVRLGQKKMDCLDYLIYKIKKETVWETLK